MVHFNFHYKEFFIFKETLMCFNMILLTNIHCFLNVFVIYTQRAFCKLGSKFPNVTSEFPSFNNAKYGRGRGLTYSICQITWSKLARLDFTTAMCTKMYGFWDKTLRTYQSKRIHVTRYLYL